MLTTRGGRAAAVLLVFLHSAAPGHASPAPVEQEAAALFGLEYEPVAAGSPILPGELSCTEDEAAPLLRHGAPLPEWQAGAATCGGRRVELLKRRIADGDGGPRWRIEDVLLLPAFTPASGRRLARPGECALPASPGSAFIAVLRPRASGRPPTVEQLWTYDLEHGRMRQQPASRLACVTREE